MGLGVGGHQLLKGAGRLVEDGHTPIGEQRVKRFGRPAGEVGNHDEASSITERAPDLPHGKIERVRVEERPHVGVVEVEPVFGVGQEAGHIGMSNASPLGLSR